MFDCKKMLEILICNREMMRQLKKEAQKIQNKVEICKKTQQKSPTLKSPTTVTP